ncbi:carboxypeptidase-like regulatory domain-containing protein [Hymenobacter terrenus]|uniref:carboxypeptidase-like regulatory domain-containing protein n=1 Tax=Hymenobacter terrenus TaxID=1629124 RepID=UPI0006194D3E|nr:carboxypeptidase-like regulatory domain-containing protein [Hymenobacter terrenus]
MRLLLLAAAFAAVCGARPAAAQSATSPAPTANNSQERIALSARPESETAGSMRLACAPLVGRVFEPNGGPLKGATVLVKGTHQVYVTDSEGKFLLAETVYQGQVLNIDAAGYKSQEVALNDCTLPRLVLELNPTARIKRTGKRAGQVIRLNNRNTNIK